MKRLVLLIILSFTFTASCATDEESSFVTAESFRANLASQADGDAATLTELRKYGVSADSEHKVEFFFYTNTLDKAKALASALEPTNADVYFGPAAGDDTQFVVTGWSAPIKMDNATVTAWSEKMTRLGYEFDCEFDGWGTYTNQ